MSDPTRQTIDRLAERQRRSETFAQARRAQLAPRQEQRRALLEQLDTELHRFVAGALPDLQPEHLALFDALAGESGNPVLPSELAANLRRRSEKAASLCRRYESEFDIYGRASRLPDQESELARRRNLLEESERDLARLEIQLDPLTSLNQERSAAGLPPITARNAASHARLTGLAHVGRWLAARSYRRARKVIGPLEQDGETLANKLVRRAQLQMDILVREQNVDVLAVHLRRERNWLEAYAEAWASRMDETQLCAAVRQALVDQLAEPAFRKLVASRFGRRWPQSVSQLFARIEAIDRLTRRFISSFDARYETGRIELSPETGNRRRTAETLGQDNIV